MAIGLGIAAEVLPPRRQADEYELAGFCSGVRQRDASRHRQGREQDFAQAPLPEGRVSTWQEHDTDHRLRLLLREYIYIIPVTVSSER